MSFLVQMTLDLHKVEPGSTVPVGVEVVNRSEGTELYEIEVEGIDPSWVAIPVPSFSLEPGETRVEKFFLKPPRDTESLAGTYPFVINIRSIETGETKSLQSALEIEYFTNFSVDVQPKRGVVSPMSRTVEFKVTVMNLGNGEQPLQMFAADNDNLFAFEFDADQISLGPGQQRMLTLTAAATKNSLLASSRLQNFNVIAQSKQSAAVAVKSTGQIEQRPLVSLGAFTIILALIALLAAWIALIPKPPTLDSLDVSADKVTVGQPVEIQWRTTNAKSVRVQIGNWIQDQQMANGSVTYVPDKPGDFAIEVTAKSGDLHTRDVSHLLSVAAPLKVAKPEILELTASERKVNVGQTFMLNYKFGDSVVRAVLHPMQRELDVKEHSIQLTADTVGKTAYTIKAFNSADEEVESSVTVTVVQPSKAKIVKFEVGPKELEVGGGSVSIDFVVADAARIELVYAGQRVDVKDPQATSNQESRHMDVPITSDTTFRLVAFDLDGVEVSSQSIVVKVKKPDPGETAPDTPTTTGGNGR